MQCSLIRNVAAKEFIATIASDDDLAMLAHSFRKQIRRNHRRVGNRLVKLRSKLLNQIGARLIERKFYMVCSEILRHGLRKTAFVELRMVR